MITSCRNVEGCLEIFSVVVLNKVVCIQQRRKTTFGSDFVERNEGANAKKIKMHYQQWLL